MLKKAAVFAFAALEATTACANGWNIGAGSHYGSWHLWDGHNAIGFVTTDCCTPGIWCDLQQMGSTQKPHFGLRCKGGKCKLRKGTQEGPEKGYVLFVDSATSARIVVNGINF